MRRKTAIGGLLLEIPQGWRFSVRDGVIAGRCNNDPGILRIQTTAANLLRHPVTHERCLEMATNLAGVAGLPPTGQQLLESVSGPYGAASFVRDKDFVRLWYCCRTAGLIIGTFGYPKELADTAAWKFLTGQCTRMIYSAFFDRTAWGAEDELTKLLVENLEAAESAASTPPVIRPPSSPTESNESQR